MARYFFLAASVATSVGFSVLWACTGEDVYPVNASSSSSGDDGGGAESGPTTTTGDGSGSVGPASLKLDPVVYRFPTTKPTTTSTAAKFSVTNAGGETSAPLQRAGLQGANTTPFAITKDTCDGKALAGGASCEVEVTFTPSIIGEVTATLLVGTLPASITGFGGEWLGEDAKGAALNSVWGDTNGPTTRVFAVGTGGRALVSSGTGAWVDEVGTSGADLYSVYGTPTTAGNDGSGYVIAAGAGPRLLRKKPTDVAWSAWDAIDPAMRMKTAHAARAGVKELGSGPSSYAMYIFGEGDTYYVGNVVSPNPSYGAFTLPIHAIQAVSVNVNGGTDEVFCAVGTDGWVYGGNPGLNFGKGESLGAFTLHGVWTKNGAASTAWVVGDGGRISRGTDCTTAAAFTSVPSNVTAQLNAVWSDGQDVYAVGNGGVILRKQGAADFQKEESGTTKDLRGVFGVASGDIYAVGDGVILHKH